MEAAARTVVDEAVIQSRFICRVVRMEKLRLSRNLDGAVGPVFYKISQCWFGHAELPSQYSVKL